MSTCEDRKPIKRGKPYAKPSLEFYGNLQQLTAGSGKGGGNDQKSKTNP